MIGVEPVRLSKSQNRPQDLIFKLTIDRVDLNFKLTIELVDLNLKSMIELVAHNLKSMIERVDHNLKSMIVQADQIILKRMTGLVAVAPIRFPKKQLALSTRSNL